MGCMRRVEQWYSSTLELGNLLSIRLKTGDQFQDFLIPTFCSATTEYSGFLRLCMIGALNYLIIIFQLKRLILSNGMEKQNYNYEW
jgi:hypothetical protein